MKTFLYMYPDHDAMEYECKSGVRSIEKEWESTPKGIEIIHRLEPFKDLDIMDRIEEKEPIWAEARESQLGMFFPRYCAALNDCIEQRYRAQGYQVVFALLDGESVEPLVEVKPKDKVIYVGMDWATHASKHPDGRQNPKYPDNDYILNQVLPTGHLRVSGFHLWDCVQRVAKQAFTRGVDVLVDEDLTEKFGSILKSHPDFKRDQYPSHVPYQTEIALEEYAAARVGLPWMLQWDAEGNWQLPSFSRLTKSQQSQEHLSSMRIA
jgi:hypothetical protein